MMLDLSILADLTNRYKNNQNIIEYLKCNYGDNHDLSEYIKIAYDLQAGSYSKAYYDNGGEYLNYTKSIVPILDDLGEIERFIHVGVGEAITLSCMLKNKKTSPKEVYGLDISWSRLKYAKKFSKAHGFNNFNFVAGNIFEMPFHDNSFDVVLSHHSLEPNGGKEKEALIELNRIAKKYIVLFEPTYEFGNRAARKRMDKHNYVKYIAEHARELRLNVIENVLFNDKRNPLNPTGMTIIKKDSHQEEVEMSNIMACPISKGSLIKTSDSFYCKSSSLAYPIIQDIPCLLRENAIVASHYLDVI